MDLKMKSLLVLSWSVIFVILIGILIAIIFSIYSFIKERKVGPITKEPVVPQWTLSQVIKANVTVYRRPFTRSYIERLGEERREPYRENFWKIHKIIKERAEMLIPGDTCIVQVALNGFTCGESCTAFERANGGTFTYQMFAGQRIQVVMYVENDMEKCAGYCIYLKDPYDRTPFSHKSIINRCYQQPTMQNPVFEEIELSELIVLV